MKFRKLFLLAGLVAAAAHAQLTYTPYTISTLAGSTGNNGFVDGTGLGARFAYPYGTAVDNSGNVYVADGNNHAVRMVTPAGVVTTFASVGATPFGVVGGIAIDKNGFLYVTDHTSGALYKIATPAGTVTTLAPAGTFSEAWGVAVDASGNCYVADSGNFVIRKVAPSGTTTVLAGSVGNSGVHDAAGTAAQFSYPVGVAVDPTNSFLYVTDASADTIRKVTISGGAVSLYAGQSTLIGTVDGGLGTALFNRPTGIAIDAVGNLYVTDDQWLVRKITAGASPIVTTLAGSSTRPGSLDGTGNSALFNQAQQPAPSGLAVDSAGNIYVADTNNSLIRRGVPSSATPPQITTQPQSQTIAPGAAATLSVAVSGTGPFTYQWTAGGGALPNATAATYTIPNFQANNAGSYQVVISGAGGMVFSDTASLSLDSGAFGFTTQPVGATIPAGVATSLSANATGATSYQWYFNGSAIAGATSSILAFPNPATTQGGSYYAIASNGTSQVTSNSVTLGVTNTGRLMNLSILSNILGSLSVGMVSGPGTTSGQQSLLFRATGPTLGTTFGIGGAMPDPTLKIVQRSNSVTVAQNTGWGSSSENISAVQAADATTGAFPLPDTTSKDSALVTPLPQVGGGYQAVISGNSGDTGMVLTEAYDATASANYFAGTTPRLVNLSCLALVASGTGSSITFGFAVGPGAGTNETVLIRAIGPTLGSLGVAGVMPDPAMVISPLGNSANILASNSGWSATSTNRTAVLAADALCSTFDPTTSSSDAAVVLTLPTGAYTAQVTSTSGAGGQILVEVYEVP